MSGDRANPAPYVSIDDLAAESSTWADDRGRRERMMGAFPAPTPGQLLYERWCGSRRSDRARYWTSMNPAERKAWEHVAEDIRGQDASVFERVVHNLPEHKS